MSYAFRRQPFKGLYLTYELLATLFIRFPLWVLLAIPRSWRPRNSWTFKRAFLIRVVRHVLKTTEHTGPFIKIPNHLAITTGVDVNGVWVGAVPQLIAGELKKWAEAVSVTSVRVPGYWTHKKGSSIKVAAPPQPGEKVIYILHGGAYIRLSAHPTDPTAAIARGLLKHVKSVHRVFSVEYRLSAGKPFKPVFPFPAALLDALAGYNYLVNVVGFSPSDVIIAGDSAGGNLALALTRYLVEYKESSEVNLPGPPSGLLLLSPWGDLGKTQESLPHSSASTCRASDYIGPGPGFNYAKRAFLGSHGLSFAEHNRYISPASLDPSLSIDFIGFPRTFIVAGGAEVLVDQIHTLRDRMIRDLGEGNGVQRDDGKVRYYEAQDGAHDYLAFTWHDPERTDTLMEISKWASAS